MADTTIVFREWTFTHGGQTWKLRRPILATERIFAAWLERRDAEWAVRLKTVSEGAYRDALALAREAASSNEYGWCRPGFIRALTDVEGTVQFLWIWFCQCYKDQPHPPGIANDVAMRTLYLQQKAGHKPGESPLDVIIGEALTDPNPLPPL